MASSGTSRKLEPLSFSQRNVFDQEAAYPGLPINNICSTLHVKGRVDAELLRRGALALIAQTPALRVRVTVAGGEPLQYISDETPLSVPLLDFTKTGEEGLESWAAGVAREHMPLCDAPLFSAAAFIVSPGHGGLLLKTHHIISDAWSQALLADRFSSAYQSLLDGQTPELPALADYAPHVQSEQEYLESAQYAADMAYWRDKCAALPKARAGGANPVGRRYSMPVSERVSRMITGYCQQKRLSPFAVFFMALQVYLARVLGQESPCVGVPVVGRRTFAEKNCVGMFVGTLPFSCDIPLAASADAFQEALLSEWYALLKHQRAPYQRIAALARDMGAHGQLFSVALSYQNARIRESADARVRFEGRWQYAGYQAQPLCVHVSDREREGRFLVDYDYLTQVYQQSDVERLHQYLMTILRGALERPDLPLARVPLLSHEEEERVLYSVNDTRVIYPDEGSVGKWLRKTCARHERRAAVISGGRRTTYKALLQKAEPVARGICALTGAAGDVTALALSRDEDLFCALLSVMLAGRAFLLLDNGLPDERARAALSQAGAKLVIVREGDDRELGVPKCTLARLSALPGDCANDADAKTLAYVACTSGTTGAPKAVAVSQGSLMNFAHAMRALYAPGAVLSACGVGFDAFLIESACALLNAQTVVLASEREMNDPGALAALITGYACGFLSLTPSRWQAYLQNAAFGAALARLEVALCGGERFPEALEKRLRARTEARIYNQYGPTETCVGVAYKLLAGDGRITVGKPMPNCRAYVLDAAGAPVPVGAPGALFIGGACVAEGYLGDEAETAAKFLPDPFEHGGRMYDTGDAARWTEDGELTILGRADRQLKIRGLRVEPGEIEARLCAHPEVTACAAALRGGALQAWYVGGIEPQEALAFLRAGLPEYMTPARAMRVPSLPLSTNGKILYDQLPDIILEETHAEDALTDTETRLLAIFRKHLGNDALPVTADFFAAGGDSLSALAMLQEAGEALSRWIDPHVLREHGSARALALLLSGADAAELKPRYPRAPDADDYPLTPQQESFLAGYLTDPDSLAYNMPGAYEATGDIDDARLENALKALIALDETLRTRFTMTPRGARMRILAEAPFSLEHIEADDLPSAMRAFTRPFDLAKPPLLRAARWRSALLLDMHHIVSDGLSGALLMQRVAALYAGQTVRMPSVRYRDIAAARQGADLTKARAYWKAQLADAPDFVDLPCDFPRPAAFDARGGTVRAPLADNTRESLRALCEQVGVTPFMALFAVFAATVYRLSGQEDMVIGTPVSLRDDAAVAEVTGLMISPAPLRVKARGDMPFCELLSQVRETVLSMLEHRALPLSEIIGLSGAQRSPDRNALYNLMFSYLPVDGSAFSLGEATLAASAWDPGISKLDMTLEVSPRAGGLSLRLEYAKALYADDTARMLARCFAEALSHALSAPDTALRALHVTAAFDRVRLVDRPRRLRTPYECATLDSFIDRAALLSPDDIAVTYGDDGRVTFAELKRMTDALAARLIRAGAQVGERVGVLARRTADMPVAMVACMKAGCAYVPLDPAYPEERMRYMLAEAGARLALVSEGMKLPEGLAQPVPIAGAEDAPFAPPEGRSADDELYVLYTSGSTGRPKGVIITHKSAANLLCDVDGLLGYEDARVLACANVIFDIFATESVLSLALGKRVCMADEEEMLLPWKMAARMEKAGVNALQLTPSRMRMCLQDAAFRKALKGMRVVMLAGEPFTAGLLCDVRGATDARVINIYGPTETTVFSGYADLTKAETVYIGSPVANTRFYVRAPEGDWLPPLARGELYIAGACVANGYAGQDALTRERFLPDPFFAGERMYKSGDIVRQRADGFYEYCGRADRQLKLDGHRIEPEEIAAQLMASGLCAEAVVVPVRLDGETRALRAYCVPQSGFSEDAALDFLAPRLPAFMLPARVTALPALPRTASGKTDRKALEDMAAEDAPRAQSDEGGESALLKVWRDALGRAPDEDASFFTQGGTSLGALTVLSGYYKLGLTFSLADFYRHPTLREQARLLSGEPPKTSPESAGVVRESIPEPLPLQDRPGCALLTGASGFLGAHLLRALRQRGARVICLTHSADIAAPCEVVRGDITKERLGLTEDVYQSLLSRVTRVWHCAADVRHYVADEGALRAVNTLGTQNLLAFARAAGADFHYISTASVAGDAANFTERDLFIGQDLAGNAYLQSKLDAERAVCQAMREGLPARIYRVGRLCARASDGVFQNFPESNAFYRVMRGLLTLAAVPESLRALPIEMTSVDLCAKACVLLSGAQGACFHVLNPRCVPLCDALSAVRPMRVLEDGAFAALLRARADDSPNIRAVAEMYFGGGTPRAPAPDCEETLARLAELAFTWQTPDARLLLSSFTDEGVVS